MPIDFEKLKDAPRVLIETALKPVLGTRIQPTGFPDLGAATYDAPDGRGGTVPTLLVESAQSMANRLEAVCWDEAADDLVPELSGLPFVRVKLVGLGKGDDSTNSLLEFHRLNSPYIMSGVTAETKTFAEVLTGELGLGTAKAKKADDAEAVGEDGTDVAGVVNLRKLAAVCFKYDPNSLVHGIFLEKIAGRLRHPRALSAFIEATGVGRADSGGVKFDRAMPAKKLAADVTGLAENEVAKRGYANVPFHRTEFTAEHIKAYFSLDLAQLRGYGLPADAYQLLVVLALWKVRAFLDSNMRLRSACELELIGEDVRYRYKDARRREQTDLLDSAEDLQRQLRDLLGKCKPLFAQPVVTELTWNPKSAAEGQVVIELPSDFPPPKPFKGPVKALVEFKKKTAKAPPKLVLKKGLTEGVVRQIEDAIGKEDEVARAVRAKLGGGEPPAQGGGA